MKYRTETVREGERLGDIDWSFDFISLAWGANRGGHNPDLIPREVEMLRQIESAFKQGKIVSVKLHGELYEPVCDVGMYDGWPYWKPIPSVMSSTWLGASWHPFTSISGVRIEELPAKES